MSISEPDKITTPWASTGSKNPIPANANNTTGAAGFDNGFPDITMTPEEAGGLPPAGQDFNGIFYEITKILQYMQAGGKPTYDAAFAAATGGYPLGAVLIGDDGASFFQNAVAGNETDPNSGGSGWVRPDLQVIELYRRSYAEAGYDLLGTFRLGVTLNTLTDAILDEPTGIVYSWGGSFPKVVPAGSTPATSGGLGDNAWIPRTDAVLRVDLFKPSGSSLVRFTRAEAGAVERTLESKGRERKTFFDYGAKCDTTTDDTAAINNALVTATDQPVTATAFYGYKVTGPLFSEGRSMIYGEGYASGLYCEGLSSTQDALTISPPADGRTWEYSGLSGVHILQYSGGRDAVKVDLEPANTSMSRFVCRDSYFTSNGVGNRAFNVINPTNTADKFFLAYFENNTFNGGLALDGVGDSINVTGNTFTGVNESLVFRQTIDTSPGANGQPSSVLRFEGNNCSANKGIYILEARSPKIRDNNLECGEGPGAGAEQALINIKGVQKRIIGAEVTGNTILHAPNCPNGVFLGVTDGAIIDGNIFGIAATGYGIVISVDAKNTYVGTNDFIPSGTGREINDLGVGTKGVLKEPALVNGWVNPPGTEKPYFIKSKDGIVTLTGVIGNGLISVGIELFTLPFGFRPEHTCSFLTYSKTATPSFGTVVLSVDVLGVVTVAATSIGDATISEIGLSAISFFSADI